MNEYTIALIRHQYEQLLQSFNREVETFERAHQRTQEAIEAMKETLGQITSLATTLKEL